MEPDLTKVSPGRREVLEKIALYESERRFDEDVENDPPTKPLLPDQVGYLNKKLGSRIKTAIANTIGDHYFTKLIKKGIIQIEGVEGKENLSALQHGAVVTCNHFSAYDNYILFEGIRNELPKKYLYKVIREGNYTSFPGLYGFLFKHCNTLPLSSNRRTMMNMLSAVNTLLTRGESILIYPEQGMWWNYRKPRPLKIGGFRMAYRAGVPVVPMLITMRHGDELDGDGYPLQIYTLHILPPVYPDKSLGEKLGAEQMKEKNYELWKEKYEEVYKVPLDYGPAAKEKAAGEAGDFDGAEA